MNERPRGDGTQRRTSDGHARRTARPGQRRASASRRRAAAPSQSGTPRALLLGIILVPLVAIIGLLVWRQAFSDKEEKSVNRNDDIGTLEREIDALDKEYKSVYQLVSGDRSDEAKAKAKRLEARLNQWLADWAAIFDPQRDEDGNLPEELSGYEDVPYRVQTMRNDLMRITNF